MVGQRPLTNHTLHYSLETWYLLSSQRNKDKKEHDFNAPIKECVLYSAL